MSDEPLFPLSSPPELPPAGDPGDPSPMGPPVERAAPKGPSFAELGLHPPDIRGPLAILIGANGYHDERFAGAPYPVAGRRV